MSRLLQPLLLLATGAALTAAAFVRGEDLGTVGPTYAIDEPHLLTAIEQQLRQKEQSGELARLEAEAKQRIVDSIEHPKPLPGLTRTESARSFYFDPSIVVRENITDAKGNILVRAGTRQNPLTVVSLSKHLLFFDGTDESQVERARELITYYQGKVKPILVAGSYLALMQRWQLAVYFDQQGALTRKLGITHVPALVSQEGLQLRVDELRL
jgi:conjugal transfer pilus assembly protein TraW